MRQAVEQQREAPQPARVRVLRRSLEALVDPLRPVPPALAESLRLVGYDPGAEPEPHYPLSVFRGVIDAVGAHLAPEDTEAERARRVGHLFIEGFGQNPVGRVFQAGLRALGPDRALSRIPSAVRYGMEGLQVDMELLGIRHWRARMQLGRESSPEFFCGCLEAMLRQIGVSQLVVEPEFLTALEHAVVIRWNA